MAKTTKTKKTRKIIGIRAHNAYSFENLEIDLPNGESLFLQGPNGSGKTSGLDIIRTAFGAGELARLIRTDKVTGLPLAETGEIVLLFDDEDNTILRNSFKADGSSRLTLKDDIRGTQTTSRSELSKKFVNSLSLNPFKWIDTTDDAKGKKERIANLLKIMPTEVSPERIEEMDNADIDTSNIDITEDKISWLNETQKQLSEERRRINVNIRDKKGTLNHLRDLLSPVKADDIRAELNSRELELESLRHKYSAEYTAVLKVREDSLDNSTSLYASHEKDVEEEYAKKYAELNKWKQDKIKEITDKSIGVSNQIRDIFDVKQKEINDKFIPEVEALNNKVTELRTKLEGAVVSDSKRSEVENEEAAIVKLEKMSERYSSQLALIEQVKISTLDSLPVKGIEIKDGDVFIDNLPFQNCNTARLIVVTFDLLEKNLGEVRGIILDDFEHLDNSNIDIIAKEAEDRNIQLFAAAVDSTKTKLTAQVGKPTKILRDRGEKV